MKEAISKVCTNRWSNLGKGKKKKINECGAWRENCGWIQKKWPALQRQILDKESIIYWTNSDYPKHKSKREAVFSDSGLNDTLNSSRKEFRLTSDFFKVTFTVRRKGAISTRFSGIVWLKTFHPDKIQVKRNGNPKYSQTCFWCSSTKKNKIRLPYSLYRCDEQFIWKLLKTQELNPSKWRSYCKITGKKTIWIKPRFFPTVIVVKSLR